jgi:transposase
MKAYSIDLRNKILQSIKEGIFMSELGRRFDFYRSMVQGYIKQLDEEDSLLAPKKRPGSRSKLETRAPCCCLSKISRAVPGPLIDRGGIALWDL